MSTEAWIFAVGFRVIDVAALIIFLVWFFRQRFDADDPPEDEGPGGGGPHPEPPPVPGGGGLQLPLSSAVPARRRLRGHGSPPERPRRRGGERVPREPARIRRPRSPVPAHRRS